ncbi:hypothetical protein FJT64_021696 [Amphibalanus amphitrite]|uniref:Uncharacterized protein n=1 Tax=Amphibalanus amphitrite TaxID=1232801 RepID=A0A6A4WJ65_AMPAM|nr:hypothetical protein FJT64_021696 [Amphibalanus amphitrite]
MDDMETRLTSLLSRELHEFKENISSQFEALERRIYDLEQHVEAKDNQMDEMAKQLQEAKEEVEALRGRAEDAELVSRLPCLVLSGAAMAPRRGAPLAASVPVPDPADAGAAGRDRAGPPPPPSASGNIDGAPGGERGRRDNGDSRKEEREDVNSLVVNTLNRCFPDLRIETFVQKLTATLLTRYVA